MPFVSLAIGAIGGAIFGAGTIAASIFTAAIGIGFNYVAGRIQASKAKKAAKQASGTQFERDYGEGVSRKVPCGVVGIAGHDCYVNTYGSANKFLQQVFALSDYPCDGLNKIWAGGKQLNLEFLPAESDGVVQRYRVPDGEYGGLMRFTFYTGLQTAADTELVANANPAGRWTSEHVGIGQCYIIAHLTYDQERLNSFPDFFFEVRGARLFDPRKDATFGGTHVWGNYATYEFSENPVVMDYNYRRGILWNGDVFLGMEMAASDLPLAKYATAANICDEQVLFIGGGGTEARYRCSVFLDSSIDHGDNIDALMSACGGVVVDSVDGSWPLIGTAQPIIETFTDDDLIPGEDLTFQRRRSMAELVNSVGGTYPEPSNMWSPAGYDTQTSAGYVGLDRRTRDFQLDLNCVPSKRQANQLASIYFNENRFEATAQIVLPPRFQTVQVGDWVQWNSARYGDRKFIVQSRSIRALTENGPRNVALSLQERDASIYAGAGVLPPVSPIPNGTPIYLNELQDWQVIPILAQGPDGRTYPAFRVSWSPIEDPTVTAIDFQWWLKTEPQNVFSKRIGADVTIGMLLEGIQSEQLYVFRHKLVAETRPTNWSGTIERTSLDGGNGDLEVYLANLNKEVLDQFAKLFGGFDDVRPILERVLTDEQLNGASTEIMRRELSRQVDNASASFTEEISVVTSDLAAAVTQVTTLQADYEDNKASVQDELAAVSTDVDALASTASTLTASVNDISVQGRVKFAVAANQAGVDARFSILIRANTAAAYKESGLFLELYTSGGVQRSRFAVLADQFVVTDGGTYTLPLVYEAGVLTLQGVRVKWADIQSAVIGNLIVGTSNIAPGAVSKQSSFSDNSEVSGPPIDGFWISAGSITIEHGFSSPPVLIFASFTSSGTAAQRGFRLVNVSDGIVMEEYGDVFNTGYSLTLLGRAWSTTYSDQPPAGRSFTTYRMDFAKIGTESASSARLINRRLTALALVR